VRLDSLTEDVFLACCGSRAWARRMNEARPFRDTEHLLETADRVWWSLTPADWREAFAAHPRIGEKSGSRWSRQEQSGAASAQAAALAELAEANREYEERFGHIFIICATGKTAEEMLGLLRARLAHDPETELKVAAQEQRKITRLRLQKWLADPGMES
jgi:OHCU decarboxylase